MNILNLENGDTLYLKLYNFLKKKIEQKEIIGKLSSIRNTAKEFNVSSNTVIKAYKILEKNKYITSKQGSGFYTIFHQRKSYYLEDYMENEEFKYNYFDDNCTINFAAASPKSDFFPIDTLKNIINKILDNEGEKALLYENPQGNLKFRETIRQELFQKGINVSTQNIQIIAGAQQGINLISKVFIQNKDIIITEDPTYRGAIRSFKDNGGEIYRIPITIDGIDIDKLENFLQTNKIKLLYLIPVFQNPTGISLSEDKALKIIEFSQKYDFYIIEDDSNSELYFKEPKNNLKHYDKYNRVIYIKSFSKIFLPGFRIGYMILPDNLILPITKAKYQADISTSGLNQRIFNYSIKNNTWNTYLENLRDFYYKKQLYFYDKLKNIKNIHIILPEGGLSFWIKLPKEITGEAFYFALSQYGIKVIPGIVFSPNFENYIRISFGECSYKDIDMGVEYLSKTLETLINLNI